ncbi:hypothetical protein SAMN05216456_0526 [Devosia crocina]|uniref:Fur family transcriptional regulator n=1 Tax=Devosia crocina TaxID=429728 RepID=A0A1I7N1E9_9HYPH|nr:hypothetical protein [Devosia crocina]SFV28480.1 hypothetical protein SAMN05216456_0526 [Devosia crocina]
MNLNWKDLTASQRSAVSLLCQRGPCILPRELAEQLINLGLAEQAASGVYCISALGSTLPPETLH